MHWVEIDSDQQNLETLSMKLARNEGEKHQTYRERNGTEPSTHAKYNSSGHPSLKISTENVVGLVVASHRRFSFEKGHQHGFTAAQFVQNAYTQAKNWEILEV